MAILAALKVLVGADTVDFKRKMTEAGTTTGVFESKFGGYTSRVERHGLKLVRSAADVGSAMVNMKNVGAGALAGLAEAAGFVELGLALGSVKVALDLLKPSIDSIEGGLMGAKPPSLELADALAEDETRFQNAAAQLQNLLDKLKLSGPEWQFSTERTKENAGQILFLTEQAQKYVREQKEQAGVYDILEAKQKIALEQEARQKALHQESIDLVKNARIQEALFADAKARGVNVQAQMNDALARGKEALRQQAEAARQNFGVWNASDVLEKANALKQSFIGIAQSGGSMRQTVEAMGPDFAKVMEVAKELGVQLPPGFENIAEAIAKGPGWQLDAMAAQFKNMPKEASKATMSSAAALEEMGNKLEGTISGGFGRGAEKGISFADQQMNEFRARIEAEGIMVPIKFNWDEFDREMASRGISRRTGGATAVP